MALKDLNLLCERGFSASPNIAVSSLVYFTGEIAPSAVCEICDQFSSWARITVSYRETGIKEILEYEYGEIRYLYLCVSEPPSKYTGTPCLRVQVLYLFPGTSTPTAPSAKFLRGNKHCGRALAATKALVQGTAKHLV